MPPRKQSAWISFRYFLCNMYMLGSCSFRNVLHGIEEPVSPHENIPLILFQLTKKTV